MGVVVLFDSGLGGLSIFAALRQLCADRGILLAADYVADSAYFPYGPREEGEICARVLAVIGAYLALPDAAKVVVIACNTASTAALAALRAEFPGVCFVGVVPAIKPAAQRSHSGVIGLLATPGTIARPYSGRLIADFAAHCTVLRHGAAGLAILAERALSGEAVDPQAVLDEIKPLFCDRRLDAVVLGCTHYPLLRPQLEQLAPWSVQWHDSGAAVAQQVVRQWQPVDRDSGQAGALHRVWSTAPLSVGQQAAFFRQGFAAGQILQP
jgi:glutamate racemase